MHFSSLLYTQQVYCKPTFVQVYCKPTFVQVYCKPTKYVYIITTQVFCEVLQQESVTIVDIFIIVMRLPYLYRVHKGIILSYLHLDVGQ